jgi:hypothetical protein
LAICFLLGIPLLIATRLYYRDKSYWFLITI